jgi:hypothetical protein
VLNIAIGNLNGWILKHHRFSYPVRARPFVRARCPCRSTALLDSRLSDSKLLERIQAHLGPQPSRIQHEILVLSARPRHSHLQGI